MTKQSLFAAIFCVFWIGIPAHTRASTIFGYYTGHLNASAQYGSDPTYNLGPGAETVSIADSGPLDGSATSAVTLSDVGPTSFSIVGNGSNTSEAYGFISQSSLNVTATFTLNSDAFATISAACTFSGISDPGPTQSAVIISGGPTIIGGGNDIDLSNTGFSWSGILAAGTYEMSGYAESANEFVSGTGGWSFDASVVVPEPNWQISSFVGVAMLVLRRRRQVDNAAN